MIPTDRSSRDSVVMGLKRKSGDVNLKGASTSLFKHVGDRFVTQPLDENTPLIKSYWLIDLVYLHGLHTGVWTIRLKIPNKNMKWLQTNILKDF